MMQILILYYHSNIVKMLLKCYQNIFIFGKLLSVISKILSLLSLLSGYLVQMTIISTNCDICASWISSKHHHYCLKYCQYANKLCSRSTYIFFLIVWTKRQVKSSEVKFTTFLHCVSANYANLKLRTYWAHACLPWS